METSNHLSTQNIESVDPSPAPARPAARDPSNSPPTSTILPVQSTSSSDTTPSVPTGIIDLRSSNIKSDRTLPTGDINLRSSNIVKLDSSTSKLPPLFNPSDLVDHSPEHPAARDPSDSSPTSTILPVQSTSSSDTTPSVPTGIIDLRSSNIKSDRTVPTGEINLRSSNIVNPSDLVDHPLKFDEPILDGPILDGPPVPFQILRAAVKFYRDYMQSRVPVRKSEFDSPKFGRIHDSVPKVGSETVHVPDPVGLEPLPPERIVEMVAEDIQYSCPHYRCRGEYFGSSEALQIHDSVHHPGLFHYCARCAIMFLTMAEFTHHVSEVHPDEAE